MPLLTAPTANMRILHPDGEVGIARAASEACVSGSCDICLFPDRPLEYFRPTPGGFASVRAFRGEEKQIRSNPVRDVAIVGAGMTPCRSRWVEKTFWELAQWAVSEAVHDAGIHIQEVEAGVAGIYNDIFEFQAIPESGLQGIVGLQNKPLMRVSNGGATGAYAMLAGYNMIASGQYDLMLVFGVEKALDCY